MHDYQKLFIIWEEPQNGLINGDDISRFPEGPKLELFSLALEERKLDRGWIESIVSALGILKLK
jgi:hypothetical protein